MEVKIYVLIDPVSCKVRYVGRTTQSLNRRLIGHLSKSKLKRTHRDFWIQKLLREGEVPKIKLIKKVKGWSYSHEVEKKFISKAVTFGFKLTNHDDRGESGVNKIISKDQKEKISKTLKERYKKGIISPTNITKVSIFDLKGNFINEYYSCSQCVKDLGIPQSSLENVLSGRVKRWKDYQVTYGSNPGEYKGREKFDQNNRAIEITNVITDEVLEFKSYKSAAEYLAVSSPTIRRYLNKTYKGIYHIIPMPV